MIGPMSAIDTLYATPFPTYEALEHFVIHELPTRSPGLPTLMWSAELDASNHEHLKRIFDSRMDPTVVREVGEAINERGGMQAMRANFYIYCHLIGVRLKDLGVTRHQWAEIHFEHAKDIEYLWHEVGAWRA